MYGEACVLKFFYDATPTVFYSITIDAGYYDTIALIISAMAAKSAIRIDTGGTFANPLTITVVAGASRLLTIDNTNASLDLTILPKGLALRLGICNSPLVCSYTTNVNTKGTWDILFPKQIYVCSPKALKLNNSNDSSLTASRKIIASIPLNVNYCDIIPFDRPFVLQPLQNNSIDYIDIEMVDENFSPLSFHNTFALTFMFYKD